MKLFHVSEIFVPQHKLNHFIDGLFREGKIEKPDSHMHRNFDHLAQLMKATNQKID